MRHRNQHFIHRDAAVLEGVAVVTDVIVVVVRISEKVALSGKNEGRTEVGLGKENLLGIFYLEDFFQVVFQVLAVFVAQVGVHLTIAQNLHGLIDVGGAMVGGNLHFANI